jgi:hypothetical protein
MNRSVAALKLRCGDIPFVAGKELNGRLHRQADRHQQHCGVVARIIGAEEAKILTIDCRDDRPITLAKIDSGRG